MRPRILALGCPRCGGALALPPGRRVLDCPWCGGRVLAETGQSLPRFRARPVIDADAAQMAMREALASPELSAGLAGRIRLGPPRLFHAPFYELVARRAGRARLDRVTLVAPRPATSLEASRAAAGQVRIPRVKHDTPDTKVVLASWSFYWPATELADWGLEALEPARLRSAEGILLERLAAALPLSEGVLLEPTVDAGSFRAAALRATPTSQSQVEVVEERLALLFYPLWRSTWEERGVGHSITVDALDGQVLRLTGPAGIAGACRRALALAGSAGLGAALSGELLLAGARAGPAARLVVQGLFLAAALAAVHLASPRILGPAELRLIRRRSGLEQA